MHCTTVHGCLVAFGALALSLATPHAARVTAQEEVSGREALRETETVTGVPLKSSPWSNRLFTAQRADEGFRTRAVETPADTLDDPGCAAAACPPATGAWGAGIAMPALHGAPPWLAGVTDLLTQQYDATLENQAAMAERQAEWYEAFVGKQEEYFGTLVDTLRENARLEARVEALEQQMELQIRVAELEGMHALQAQKEELLGQVVELMIEKTRLEARFERENDAASLAAQVRQLRAENEALQRQLAGSPPARPRTAQALLNENQSLQEEIQLLRRRLLGPAHSAAHATSPPRSTAREAKADRHQQ